MQTERSLYNVETVECSFQNPVVVIGSLQAINQKYEDAKMFNMKGWKKSYKVNTRNSIDVIKRGKNIF